MFCDILGTQNIAGELFCEMKLSCSLTLSSLKPTNFKKNPKHRSDIHWICQKVKIIIKDIYLKLNLDKLNYKIYSAKNFEHSEFDSNIKDNDEVAFFPTITGG